ncbi:MAG: arsinothricin resistance N-acetyltransferase ArsN1 [Firmicutes bacterium]|nr:arsinothricin resistance N-acetyltransferase ArsN1 [Bacillota bacterium]
MNEWTFRSTTPADWPKIADLLAAAHLPLEGAENHLSGFLLAFRNDSLAGCAAFERYGPTALLRSVAVTRVELGTGLGQELVRRLLDQAYADGLKNVVLLTTTAARFFKRFGFRTISRAEVPTEALVSTEFQGACPASAIAMMLGLQHPPILVRPAAEEDLPAVTRIYNQGIEDQGTLETELRTVDERREWLQRRPSRNPVIVAVRQGEVQGWASLNPFSPRQAYHFVADVSVYVGREKRGTGLGFALMINLIEQARALSYHKLVLTTFPQNTAAIQLYEKCGFRTVGDYREQGFLGGRWTDTRLMELLL